MLVRALCPDDAPALAEGFEQLSEASRYRRFFTAKPHLSEQSLAFLTAIDHHDHEALVAVEPDSGQLLGVARFIRDPGSRTTLRSPSPSPTPGSGAAWVPLLIRHRPCAAAPW